MSPQERNAPERCALCHFPIDGTGVGEGGRFCCSGCKKVFEILSHLDESARPAYLATARRLGIVPSDVGTPRAEPEEKPLPADPAAVREERLFCTGLVCPSCSWVVEQVLLAADGVESAAVDFFSGTARVRYHMARTTGDELGELLRPLGYGLEPIRDEERARSSRRFTLEFTVTAILTMNLMSLAFLRYAEGLGWLDAVPAFLPWLEMILAIPVLYIGWLPMVRRTASALRKGRMTMDLLLGIGVAAAALLSGVSLFVGREDFYFETCAGLVTISLLARMIEARLREKAAADLSKILSLRVTRARALDADRNERYADIEQVQPGDSVVMLPGETVPFDGILRGDPVTVSEAVLTGEPGPIAKVKGDPITAGSQVLQGRLEMEVVRRFDQTGLSRIADAVARALAGSEGRLRAADRITAWFVPAVLIVAVSAWAVRWLVHGMDYALAPDGWFPSVAVLAVACPCAFSLAGICAVTAATGALLRRGFLVKEIAQLDDLFRVRHLVFDKTGTVTEGKMTVEQLVWKGEARTDYLGYVLAAETRSGHPIAQALRAYLNDRDVAPCTEKEIQVEDLPGQGRIARFKERSLHIGSAALFDEVFEPAQMGPTHSAVWFGFDRRAEGCFLITDTLRPNAQRAIAELKDLGLSNELLSGDRTEVTEHVAARVGIDRVTGQASIRDKAEIVQKQKDKGLFLAFVGDGTNDALAMSQAAVSIALARSTDEALGASGFVVLKNDIAGLTELFVMGRKLNRVVRGNFIWAFAFNTLFIPVAAAGKLVPLAAVLLMLVSSSAVLLNSLRMRR